MCGQIVTRIDLFKAVRQVTHALAAYSSKKGTFDEHTTQRDHFPDSSLDQLKGMWLCLKNTFFF